MVNKTAAILIILLASFMLPAPAFADITDSIDMMNNMTLVYFEKDGKPYNGRVKFKINCIGWRLPHRQVSEDEVRKSENIYNYEGNCAGYGCEARDLYAVRLHIDRCTLNGILENGENFKINFPELVDFDRCISVESGTEESSKYFSGKNGRKCELRFDISGGKQITKKYSVRHPVEQKYETRFLLAQIMTVLIEMGVLLIFVWFIYGMKHVSIKSILFAGTIASMITLPYLWFVLPAYFKEAVLQGEALAILVEGLIYSRMLDLSIAKAMIISSTANLVSFIFGLMFFFSLFPW
jgi:hypothetical protein